MGAAHRIVMAGACCVAIATVASPARAADAAPVTWVAPASGECPDTEAFAALVAELGGVNAASSLAIRAETWQDAAGWHARIEASSGEQRFVREIQAATCAEAARAAALVVALLAADATAPESTAPPAPVSPPAPPPRVVSPPDAAPRGHDLGADVRLDAGVGVGALPGVAAHARVVLGGGLGRWRLELTGAAWMERHSTVMSGAGAELSLWAVGARGCFAPGGWRACAGAELGELGGSGTGTALPVPGSARWTALVASLGYRWKYSSWLGFVASGEVSLPTERAVFVVDGSEAHVVAPVDARLSLGIETTIF